MLRRTPSYRELVRIQAAIDRLLNVLELDKSTIHAEYLVPPLFAPAQDLAAALTFDTYDWSPINLVVEGWPPIVGDAIHRVRGRFQSIVRHGWELPELLDGNDFALGERVWMLVGDEPVGEGREPKPLTIRDDDEQVFRTALKIIDASLRNPAGGAPPEFDDGGEGAEEPLPTLSMLLEELEFLFHAAHQFPDSEEAFKEDQALKSRCAALREEMRARSERLRSVPGYETLRLNCWSNDAVEPLPALVHGLIKEFCREHEVDVRDAMDWSVEQFATAITEGTVPPIENPHSANDQGQIPIELDASAVSHLKRYRRRLDDLARSSPHPIDHLFVEGPALEDLDSVAKTSDKWCRASLAAPVAYFVRHKGNTKLSRAEVRGRSWVSYYRGNREHFESFLDYAEALGRRMVMHGIDLPVPDDVRQAVGTLVPNADGIWPMPGAEGIHDQRGNIWLWLLHWAGWSGECGPRIPRHVRTLAAAEPAGVNRSIVPDVIGMSLDILDWVIKQAEAVVASGEPPPREAQTPADQRGSGPGMQPRCPSGASGDGPDLGKRLQKEQDIETYFRIPDHKYHTADQASRGIYRHHGRLHKPSTIRNSEAWKKHQRKLNPINPRANTKRHRQLTAKILSAIGKTDDPSAPAILEETAWEYLLEKAPIEEERQKLLTMSKTDRAARIQMVIEHFDGEIPDE